MVNYNSEFLNVITERGFLHQCTDLEALDKHASSNIIPAYIGFDCTAPSLHVGSLLPVMLLRWLQKTGHKPIVLMGGGTTKVGDPSGKDESRQLLTEDKINSNMDGIKTIFSKYLDFGDGDNDAIIVNNATWLDKLKYIDFLRTYGPHFTINRMMSFDSVKLRLEREQALTFLEFNYMILQAYDFLELNKKKNCKLQIGGSDQWGNIVNGIELARRVDGTEVYGVTTPLITLADGGKMASKPYASSGAYINRMSDFCKGCAYNVKEKTGPTACPFNYMYWAFLIQNEAQLDKNPRMAMPYRTLAKWSLEKKASYLNEAETFLESLNNTLSS